MDTKKFRLTDPKDDSDVMGGLLLESNPYVSSYGAPLAGNKPAKDLEIGESSLLRYSLSGSSGVYRLSRVE